MTPERAKEIVSRQAQWPYWGNLRRFMTADEIHDVNRLWDDCLHGGSSFASTIYKIAAK